MSAQSKRRRQSRRRGAALQALIAALRADIAARGLVFRDGRFQ